MKRRKDLKIDNMKSAYVYLQLYRLFDDITPIPVDCGQLCEAACCKGDDSGMFLFPGEEAVYDLLKPEWLKIEESDFTYMFKDKIYHVPIAMCSGSCDRYERPLACRIFPLTPYINHNGELEVIIDPRAKSVCRLAKAFKMEDFSRNFVKNVERVSKLLCTNKRTRAFLEEYSRYLDEFLRFFE